MPDPKRSASAAAPGTALPDVAELFSYDRDARLRVESSAEVSVGDVLVRALSYDDSTGRRVRATLVSTTDATGGPGVVIAHGGSADGRRWFLPEAVELAWEGCTVLLGATSLPRHGDVDATRDALRAAVLVQRRGLDVLTDWAGIDPGRLGYYGHSAGAMQGAVLSAVEPRLAGLVLASAGTGATVRLAEAELRNADVHGSAGYLAYLEQFDPVYFVGVPGQRRLLFQHGLRDQTIRQDEAERLYAAAAPPAQWRDYPCGHATPADPRARRDRREFLLSLSTTACARQPGD